MYSVILSDDAVRVMVASALEAYSSPHGRTLNIEKHVPLETIGGIWGHETQRDDQTCFHVVSADVETSADRRSGSVMSKVESFAIRQGFYQFMNPEVKCLGNFHSHPWQRDEKGRKGKVIQGPQDIEKQRLYRFSGEPIGVEGNPTDDYCQPSWGRLRKRNLKYVKHAPRLAPSGIVLERTRRDFWSRPWAERSPSESFDAKTSAVHF